MAQTSLRLAQASVCRSPMREVAKTSCSTRGSGWPRVRMLSCHSLLVLLAIFGSGRVSRVTCLQVHHLQDLQQTASQPQSLEQNAVGQGPYYSDYGLTADNLINLGQPYFNNKRARKMSAFMPMRGRKDGRDARNSAGQSMFEGSTLPEGELSLSMPFRESDGGEASILRLLRASLAASGPDQGSGTIQWMGAPAPRQFANQLAMRHMLVSGPQSAPHQLTSIGSLEGTGYSFESSEPEALMQAKPRRAFHPMRGKKSEAMFASPELDFNGMELQADV